jgi:hypothetical protein
MQRLLSLRSIIDDGCRIDGCDLRGIIRRHHNPNFNRFFILLAAGGAFLGSWSS